MTMVRSGYAALLEARDAALLDGAVIDGDVIQPLRLVMPDDTVLVALYTMQKQHDGAWRIAGCVIAPSTLKTAWDGTPRARLADRLRQHRARGHVAAPRALDEEAFGRTRRPRLRSGIPGAQLLQRRPALRGSAPARPRRRARRPARRRGRDSEPDAASAICAPARRSTKVAPRSAIRPPRRTQAGAIRGSALRVVDPQTDSSATSEPFAVGTDMANKRGGGAAPAARQRATPPSTRWRRSAPQ